MNTLYVRFEAELTITNEDGHTRTFKGHVVDIDLRNEVQLARLITKLNLQMLVKEDSLKTEATSVETLGKTSVDFDNGQGENPYE